jgi:membrane-bound lytic murein transglycosylase B
LVLTGVLIAGLIGIATAAGATVVPSLATPSAEPPKYQPPPPVLVAKPTPAPSTPAPSATPTPAPIPTGPVRAASAFNTWAFSLSKHINIPVTALEAYAYAEWVLGQTRPTCKVQWTTIAGIGSVVSDHGRTGNRILTDEGVPQPAYLGPALDGLAGRAKVQDTDGGALDGDTTWDHPIGPMQLIPSMWRASGVDADGDGLANPHDVDDAALSAAYQLCSANQDLSSVANWKGAVNNYGLARVIDSVYQAAQQYGVMSKDQRYPEQRR